MSKPLICTKCGAEWKGTENIDERTFICMDCKIKSMRMMTLHEYEEWGKEIKRRNDEWFKEKNKDIL